MNEVDLGPFRISPFNYIFVVVSPILYSIYSYVLFTNEKLNIFNVYSCKKVYLDIYCVIIYKYIVAFKKWPTNGEHSSGKSKNKTNYHTYMYFARNRVKFDRWKRTVFSIRVFHHSHESYTYKIWYNLRVISAAPMLSNILYTE